MVTRRNQALRMDNLEISDPTLKELVNEALEISRRRRDTLADLRTALQQEDDAEALRLARQLCGITHE